MLEPSERATHVYPGCPDLGKTFSSA